MQHGPSEHRVTLYGLRAASTGRSSSQPSLQGKGRVFLMAATLRPETMFGQTNCWVLPDGTYGAYTAAEPDAVYVMSARSARNLGFQDGLAQPGEQEPLATVSGRTCWACR